MSKLPSGTSARGVEEWKSKNPDAKVPTIVQLRIFERQGGKCAITGTVFKVGDKKRLDHIVPLADGGLHAEQNLQWISDDAHKIKTKEEAAVRKKIRKKRKSHLGIKDESKPKIKSAGFPKIEKEPKHQSKITFGPSNLARRFM